MKINSKKISKGKYVEKICSLLPRIFFIFFLLLSYFISPFSASADIADSLIGYWTFDGKNVANGGIKDSMGNFADGAIVSNSTTSAYVLGKIGQALDFSNGSNNNGVKLGTTPSPDAYTGITLSAWVKTRDNTAPSQAIISKSDGSFNNVWLTLGPGSGICQNGKPAMTVGNASDSWLCNNSVSVLQNNTWHHVVGTADSSGRKLYLDGALIASDSAPYTVSTSGLNWYIGARQTFNLFKGSIDDARVYSRVLSATEIAQLYKQGQTTTASSKSISSSKVGLYDGVVGYWTLDGKDTNWSTGTTNDLSGNGNNGKLVNMSTTSSPTQGKVGQALNFGVVSRYINLGNPSTYNTLQVPLTITGWFYKYSTGPNLQTVFGHYSDTSHVYKLIRIDNGVFRYYTSTSGGSFQFFGTMTPSNNAWHFFAVSVSGSLASPSVTITLDGNSESSSLAALDSSAVSFVDTYIGANAAQPTTEYFGGKIDDIRLYNRALSTAEHRELFKQGQSKFAVPNTNKSGIGLNSGLLGHWTFDGKDTNWSTGITNDLSGNGLNGTMVNISTSTSPLLGKIGQAFNLNGSSMYVKTSRVLTSVPYSISAWIKPSRFGSDNNGNGIFYQGALSGDAGTRFLIATCSTCTASNGNTNTILFANEGEGNNYTSASAGSITLNVWQHVVVTLDSSGNSKIYVNGVQKGSRSGGGTTSPSNNNSYMGVWINTADTARYFQGGIDDIKTYNKALSSTEVMQLYKSGQSR